jgi:hypothetical protein
MSTQSLAELVTHVEACYEPVSIKEMQSGPFRSQLERVCVVCADRLRLKRRESSDRLRKQKHRVQEDISKVGDPLVIVPATLYSPRRPADQNTQPVVMGREHKAGSVFM